MPETIDTVFIGEGKPKKENPVQQLLKESLHWANNRIPRTVESHAILAHVASRDRLPINYKAVNNLLNPDAHAQIVENQFSSIHDYFSLHHVVLTDQEEQVISTGGFKVHHGKPVLKDLVNLSGEVNRSVTPISLTQQRIAMDSAFIFEDGELHRSADVMEQIRGYYSRLNTCLTEMISYTREFQHLILLANKAEKMNVDIAPIKEQLENIRHALMQRNDLVGRSQGSFLKAGVRVNAKESDMWRNEMDKRMSEPENIKQFAYFNQKFLPDQYPQKTHEMNALLFRTRAEEVLNAKFIELKKTLPENKYPTLNFSLMIDPMSTFKDQKDFLDEFLKADDSTKNEVAQIFGTTYDVLEEFASNFHEDKSNTQSGFTFIKVDVNAFVEMNQITQDEYINLLRFGGIQDALITVLTPDIEKLAKIYGGIWVPELEKQKPLSDIKEDFKSMGASENDQAQVANILGKVYFHSFSGNNEQLTPSKN